MSPGAALVAASMAVFPAGDPETITELWCDATHADEGEIAYRTCIAAHRAAFTAVLQRLMQGEHRGTVEVCAVMAEGVSWDMVACVMDQIVGEPG